MDKPAEMFDRDFEWAELTRFAALPGPRATLGVVSGRLRQGKKRRVGQIFGAVLVGLGCAWPPHPRPGRAAGR